MSIRDIIEKWHLISANYAQHGYTAAVHARDFEEMRDDFASAIEELALMEAVCEVVREDHQVFGSHNTPHTPPWEECVVCTALDRLTAYRKEHGL